MGHIFSPFAGWTGDRKGVRKSETATQLANAKATRTVDGDGLSEPAPRSAGEPGRCRGDAIRSSCR